MKHLLRMNTINQYGKPPRFRLQCVTLGLLVAVLAFLALPTFELPINAGDETHQPGDEVVELRGKYSKVYWLGGNEYQLIARTSSEHYKDDPEDPAELWKEIKTAIVPSERANWDWEVTKGHWHLLIREDTSVAMGKDGHWAGFRLDGIAYLDYITKEYVVLQNRQSVTATVDGNKIRWEEIFYGVNLEYVYTSDRFRENVEVTQKARDWLAAHPPSDYGLSNQNSFLVFYSECDWRDSYQAKDNTGTDVNWENANEFSDSFVNFLHPVKDYVVAQFTPNKATMARASPDFDYQVNVHKRFFKENDRYWLLFGSSITKLNQFPQGTIVFDPDTFYPDPHEETSSVDGRVYFLEDNVSFHTLVVGAGTGAVDNDAEHICMNLQASTESWYAVTRGIFLFNTAGLPDVCTITGAILSLNSAYKIDGLSATPDICIYSSAPASNTVLASGDYDSLGTEALATPITYAAWDDGGWNAFTLLDVNSDGFATNADGTYINKEGVTKLGTRNANYDVADELDPGNHDPPGGGSNTNSGVKSYFADQGDTGSDPKLVVTYSVAEPPTVITNAATSVEETTATLSGNITATGGENCSDRGFFWDIDSGDSYSSNWTENGNFGVGEFTHGLTALTKGELYYYIATANNSAGTDNGTEQLFLTKPDEPNTLIATPGDTQISLSWNNGTGSDNTTITGKIGSYPANRADGTVIYDSTGTSCNHTGLTNGDHWYYRAWSWCTEGAEEQYSDLYAQADATPEPTPPPGMPTNFTLTDLGGITISANWTATEGAETYLLLVNREEYPSSANGTWEIAYSDNATSANLTGYSLGTQCFFLAFGHGIQADIPKIILATILGVVLI